MKKYIDKNFWYFILCISFFTFFCTACGDKNTENPPDIVGQFSWKEWKEKAGWKDYYASSYIPDSSIVNALKPKLNEKYEFVIYASNWCHADCETQVPRVIKFLTTSGIDESKITIIGVSRDKSNPSEWIEKYFELFPSQIRIFVPTIVILHDSIAIGFVKAEASDFPQWQSDINQLVQ